MQIVQRPPGNTNYKSYRSETHLYCLAYLDAEVGIDHTDHTDHLSEMLFVRPVQPALLPGSPRIDGFHVLIIGPPQGRDK